MLYWTDIRRGQIREHHPATGRNRLIWQGNMQVGGFALTRSGGMILCSEQGVFLLAPHQVGRRNAIPTPLFDLPLGPGELANDITVDPRGRLFVGTHYVDKPGASRVFRLEPGKTPERVLDGITCSNGMTFSRNKRVFYHTNSGARRIDRYDYDINTGAISNQQPFFQGTPEQGTPDGLTLDAEGCLWVAFWGGGAVRRLRPDGRIIRQIDIPARQPSSVMFGGPELRDLYITSASEGAPDSRTGRDTDGTLVGGPLYHIRLPVSGRPEWLADSRFALDRPLSACSVRTMPAHPK